MATPSIQCHYDVLGVDPTADAATIKKAHRKLALKFHPDKNGTDQDAAAEQFRLVQQAYETLSDPVERKWYDDHRDAILNGWSASGGGKTTDMLFDVVPYTYAGCFRGFGDGDAEFYAVYRFVFRKIYDEEENGTRADGSSNSNNLDYLQPDFGAPDSPWSDVATFYQGWESFASGLNFAWADLYDVTEAPNRRVRRAMEDENKKARRTAKRARNDDVLALVRFVKKRDPRVQAKLEELELEKLRKSQQQEQQAAERKRMAQQAREDWKERAKKNMAQREEEDRLAGRLRLADLDEEEDDYDYGRSGGKKKKKKKRSNNNNNKKGKNKNSNFQETHCDDQDEAEDADAAGGNGDNDDDNDNDSGAQEPLSDTETPSSVNNIKETAAENDGDDAHRNNNLPDDAPQEHDDDDDEDDSSEEEEPDVWRCECCRKDFKSEAQLTNHCKSKKHKEAYKKYQKKQEIMDDYLVS